MELRLVMYININLLESNQFTHKSNIGLQLQEQSALLHVI